MLVTGAAGVVGRSLLARLDKDSTVCLTHQSSIQASVATACGDITKRHFGLSFRDYADLAEHVDVVVHLAASTRFDTSREEYLAVNHGGTVRVLEFASDADARVVHVSTAFVEIEPQPPVGFVDPGGYIESKRRAEQAVRNSGLDFHIVRPPVVLENPRPGVPQTRQGFHFFMNALLNEQMPVVPSDENARMDFVSAELVAEALALMVERRPPGELSRLTAGAEAWSVEKAIKTSGRLFAECGANVVLPRLVPREMIERLMKPAFYEELPKRYVRRFEQMDSIAKVLLIPRPFESSLGTLRAHYGVELELGLEEAFRSTVHHLMATRVGVPA